jgi:hypothetical protein
MSEGRRAYLYLALELRLACRCKTVCTCVLDPSLVSNSQDGIGRATCSVYLSVSLPVQPVYLSIDLPACLSVYLSESVSLRLSLLLHSLSTPSRALTLQVKSPDLIP